MSARAAQLIRLLGSPVDGEALNACRALGRLLVVHGRDWHWLADLADRHLLALPNGDRSGIRRPPWQRLAMEILQCGRGRLKPYEISFLESMATWPRQLSPKQAALLETLAARFKAEAA